jgi:hypothetical protein
MVSFEFFMDIILPAALWSWGLTQSLTEMSTRIISWEVKAASAQGCPYLLHVLTVLKSMSLNLLEPSGPFKVCNWIYYLTLVAINSRNFSNPTWNHKVTICDIFLAKYKANSTSYMKRNIQTNMKQGPCLDVALRNRIWKPTNRNLD